MDQITDNIYLGDINAANINNLKKENITKVLTVTDIELHIIGKKIK